MYAHPVVSWPLAFFRLEFIQLVRSPRHSMPCAEFAQRKDCAKTSAARLGGRAAIKLQLPADTELQ
jgi:hypothetical protein